MNVQLNMYFYDRNAEIATQMNMHTLLPVAAHAALGKLCAK